MLFSSNQVRQLYVVDSNHSITVNTMDSMEKNGGKVISMTYTSNGDTSLIDYIEKCDIRKYNYLTGASKYCNIATLTMNSNLAVGDDMQLIIDCPFFYGDTNENHKVFVVNAVVTTAGAANTAATLVTAINTNKEVKKYFCAYKDSDDKVVLIMPFNTGDYRRGLYSVQEGIFGVESSIFVDASETNKLADTYTQELFTTITYGKATSSTVSALTSASVTVPTGTTVAVGNSYELADLEYFCHGFRGDIYRGMGFPNVIHYDYLLTPGNSTNYDVIDIHYYWRGDGNLSDASEKVITIIGTTAALSTLKSTLAAAVASLDSKITALDTRVTALEA